MINPMDGSCLVYSANPARKLASDSITDDHREEEKRQQKKGNSFVQKTKIANQLWGETFGSISKLPGSKSRQKVGCSIFPPPFATQTCEKCIELKSIEIECDGSKGRIELSAGPKFSVELRFHRQFDSKADRLDLMFEKQDDDDAVKIPVMINGVTSSVENGNFSVAELLKLDADFMRLSIDFSRRQNEMVGVYRLRIVTSHKNDVDAKFDYFLDDITIL